jgi:hypothetical protein
VAGDQLLEGVGVDVVVGPRQHAPQTRLNRPDQIFVLGVVDEQRHALSLAHVCELRPGEVRVQVQHPGPQPAGGECHVDEPAVVAAQDPDRVTLAKATSPKRGRERDRAIPELGERQHSELVDEPGPVGVAHRRDLDRGADLTEPVHRAENCTCPGGRFEREHPGAPGVGR